MFLESGQYQIASALGDGILVGRRLAEDRSLRPKAVVTLPRGSPPPHPWQILKQDNGSYILRAAGAPTAAINDKLFAILLDQPEPTQWKIVPSERDGKGAYIVTKFDSPDGWVATEPEQGSWGEQISVKPLIVGPSEPPFYPPTEVFIFTRLDD